MNYKINQGGSASLPRDSDEKLDNGRANDNRCGRPCEIKVVIDTFYRTQNKSQVGYDSKSSKVNSACLKTKT